MSAETLRRAAALMRERAEAVAEECGVTSADDAPWFDATDFYGGGGNAPDPVHAHVASWHPALALAVADWLEAAAADLRSRQRGVDALLAGVGAAGSVQIDSEQIALEALAVARAYLGEDQ